MKKFQVSFKGLKEALKHKAVLIQVVLGICAIIGGFVIQLNTLEWCIFILCIGMVLSFEIINTCIEKICDFIQPEYDQKIGLIKDISSSAVLVASIAAFVICILITIHKIGGLI